MATPSTLDDELTSDAFADNPFPAYARWRDDCPVRRSEVLDAWLICRYDDVRAAFADYRTFAQSRAFDGFLKESLGVDPLVQLDPPEHREVRRLFSPHFRPRVLEQQMAAVIAETVAGLVAGLRPGVPFELRQTLGRPLTMQVMASMIGSANSDELDDLYKAVLGFMRDTRVRLHDPDRAAAGRAAGAALMEYLADLRRARRPAPGLNLIAELPNDSGVDEEVVIGSFAQLLLAGVENTVAGIATTVYGVLAHPEQRALVRADPSLAGRAFDEAIRWVTPVQMMGKVVAAPVEIAGERLEPGDEVLLVQGSANRDPAEWDDPDAFSVGRSNLGSVAFGTGVHICLGAPLARLEAATLVEQLFRAQPGLELEREPRFVGGPINRVPEELWVVPA